MLPQATLEEARDLLALLQARGMTLATAESCTGGLIAAALTAIAGSSAVVTHGFVTYSNEAKRDVLGIPWGGDRGVWRGQRRGGAADGGGRAGPQRRRGGRQLHRHRRAGRRGFGVSPASTSSSPTTAAAARALSSGGAACTHVCVR